MNSQEELLIPDGVQVAKDSLGPALGFAHLHSDVRVARARLILRLQTLSTHDQRKRKRRQKDDITHDSIPTLTLASDKMTDDVYFLLMTI